MTTEIENMNETNTNQENTVKSSDTENENTENHNDNKSHSNSPNSEDSNLKKVRVFEEIWEVEKRAPFGSYHPSYYEYEDGTISQNGKEEINQKLPNEWQWEKDWEIDYHKGGIDGWLYGRNLSRAENTLCYVRRRKWIRPRVKSMTESETQNLSGAYEILGEKEIHQHISQYTSKLRNSFQEARTKTKKPNILLLGGSGTGKSSLVNAVFGAELAEIGEGKPITKTYKKFTRDDIPVVIYDSRGIEHGSIEDGFVAETIRFLKKIRQEHSIDSHVHCVWYVLDLTQARFQPFEANFCREYLKGIPIIFVLNKSDAVSEEVRQTMYNTVKNFNLPNCHGIYLTVSSCKNFDSKVCIKCQSGRIRKRLKGGTCTIMCKECGDKTTMEKTRGIDELAEATLSVLPNLVQDVFIFSQKENIEQNDHKAKEIIKNSAQDVALARGTETNQRIVNMSSELLSNYNVDMFVNRAQEETQRLFETIYRSQRFRKKARLIISDIWTKNSIAQALVVVSGIHIVNGVHNLTNSLLQASFTESMWESFDFTDELVKHMRFDVRHDDVKRAARSIAEHGLDAYVDQIKFEPLASPNEEKIGKEKIEKEKVEKVEKEKEEKEREEKNE